MATKWTGWALVLIALAGIAYFVLRDDGGTSPDAGGGDGATGEHGSALTGSGDGDGRGDAQAGGRGGPELFGRGAALVGDGDVLGRVLDFESRASQAGVRVRIVGAAHGGRPVDVTAITGKDGRFHLARVPAGIGYAAHVLRDDRVQRSTRDLTVRARDVLDLGILWLGEKAGLEGVIVDEQGHPVADADVRLLPAAPSFATIMQDWGKLLSDLDREPTPLARATTDGRGQWRLSSVDPGAYSLVSQAPGHHQDVRQVAAVAGAAESIRIVLTKAVTVRGRVVDHEGTAIGGARVALIDQASNLQGFVSRIFVETADDGTFEIAAPPASERLLAMVAAPGYPTAAENIPPGEDTVEIVLHGGATLTIRVLDPDDDAPMSGVQVVAMLSTTPGMASQGGSLVVGTTNDMGEVTLDARVGYMPMAVLTHPERGTNLFTPQMAATGLGTLVQGPQEVKIVAGANQVVLRLPSGRVVEGRVLDAQDRPVPGVTVSLVGGMGMGGGRAVTDSDGRYRLGGVPRLPLLMISATRAGYVQDPGTNRIQGTDTEAMTVTHDIRVAPAASIQGIVRGPEGAPVAGALVRVTPDGDEAENLMASLSNLDAGPVITNASGQYIVDTVLPGSSYRILARAGGFLDGATAPFAVKAPGLQRAPVLQFRRGRTLRLTVTDPDGRPLPRARVDVDIPSDEKTEFDPLGAFQSHWRGAANAEGEVVVPTLPPGEITITVRHDDYAPRTVTHVLPDTEEVTPLEVAVARAIEITGIVRDGEGQPLSEVFVSLTFEREDEDDMEDAPSVDPEHTDAEGAFRLRSVPADWRVSLSFTKAGFQPRTVPLVGRPDGLEITLARLSAEAAERISAIDEELSALYLRMLDANDDETRAALQKQITALQVEKTRLEGREE